MKASVTAPPRLVPVHKDDEPRSGFYIARRKDWADPQRIEIIWLEVWQDDGGMAFNLWRCGGSKPENPNRWEFQVRVAGIRAPEEPIELSATVLH